MSSVRLVMIAVLLFMVVMVDFTGRFMSMLADGVLVAGIVAIGLPLFRRKE